MYLNIALNYTKLYCYYGYYLGELKLKLLPELCIWDDSLKVDTF